MTARAKEGDVKLIDFVEKFSFKPIVSTSCIILLKDKIHFILQCPSLLIFKQLMKWQTKYALKNNQGPISVLLMSKNLKFSLISNKIHHCRTSDIRIIPFAFDVNFQFA